MYSFIKTIFAAAGAWLWVALMPAIPVAVACSAMVVADVWTARRLQGRLARKRPTARQLNKFSSARFGRAVVTLAKIYAALALAALVQHGVAGEWTGIVRFTGGTICFWQAVSVLENETSANPHSWARLLSRFLADKAC